MFHLCFYGSSQNNGHKNNDFLWNFFKPDFISRSILSYDFDYYYEHCIFYDIFSNLILSNTSRRLCSNRYARARASSRRGYALSVDVQRTTAKHDKGTKALHDRLWEKQCSLWSNIWQHFGVCSLAWLEMFFGSSSPLFLRVVLTTCAPWCRFWISASPHARTRWFFGCGDPYSCIFWSRAWSATSQMPRTLEYWKCWQTAAWKYSWIDWLSS